MKVPRMVMVSDHDGRKAVAVAVSRSKDVMVFLGANQAPGVSIHKPRSVSNPRFKDTLPVLRIHTFVATDIPSEFL